MERETRGKINTHEQERPGREEEREEKYGERDERKNKYP